MRRWPVAPGARRWPSPRWSPCTTRRPAPSAVPRAPRRRRRRRRPHRNPSLVALAFAGKVVSVYIMLCRGGGIAAAGGVVLARQVVGAPRGVRFSPTPRFRCRQVVPYGFVGASSSPDHRADQRMSGLAEAGKPHGQSRSCRREVLAAGRCTGWSEWPAGRHRGRASIVPRCAPKRSHHFWPNLPGGPSGMAASSCIV